MAFGEIELSKSQSNSAFKPLEKVHANIHFGQMVTEGTAFGMNFGFGRLGYGLSIGVKTLSPRKEATGVDYTDLYDWNQFPEHYVSQHSKKYALHYGLGYITNVFFVNVYAGKVNQFEYVQSFDATRDLSESGNYYVSRKVETKMDVLVELGGHYKFLSASVTASQNLGFGWTVGLIHKFKFD